MSPSETITGLRLATRRTACHIRSEASAEPPGESMRSTTALTSVSSAKSRIALTNDSACALLRLSGAPRRIVPSR